MNFWAIALPSLRWQHLESLVGAFFVAKNCLSHPFRVTGIWLAEDSDGWL